MYIWLVRHIWDIIVLQQRGVTRETSVTNPYRLAGMSVYTQNRACKGR